jgi:hypothetical protein
MKLSILLRSFLLASNLFFIQGLSTVSLRGGGKELQQQEEEEKGNKSKGFINFDFSKLKCTLESFSNAEKCADSLNSKGDPCSFCSMTDEDSGEQAGGLCVDPDVAPSMQQMNPQISCTNVDNDVETQKVENLQDYHDFKCTIKGMNDEEKCSHMHTQDGKKHCEYCSMDGPLGEKGVCVCPAHARKLKNLSPSIHCSRGSYNEHSQEEEQVEEASSSSSSSVNSPITDCNLSGADIETCLDPSKVNGSKCIWCDAAIGGFCFPESWSKTAGRFLNCKDKPDNVTTTTSSSSGSTVADAAAQSSPFGSNCLKIGLKEGDEKEVKDCRNAIDESSGEHCVFCKASALGGIGLCMPPQWKGNGGKFYECDNDLVDAVQIL